MFKNLTNLSLKRNAKQAIGFFLAYLLLGGILSALCGLTAGTIHPTENSFDFGVKVGAIFSPIYSFILYFMIYRKKEMNSFLFILIGLINIIIAYYIGMIIPIIIISFLTTREDKSKEHIVGSNIEDSINIKNTDYVIYPPRGKYIFLCISSLIFVFGGFLMLSTDFIAGIIGILFFGLGVIVILCKIISRRPILIINENGIFDNRSYLGFGLIKWEEIDDLFIYEFKEQEFLGIVPKNEEMFLSRLGTTRRKTVEAEYELTKALINIAQITMPIKLEKLLSIMKGYMNKIENNM